MDEGTGAGRKQEIMRHWGGEEAHTIKKNIKLLFSSRNRLRKCIIPLREVEDNGLKLRGTNKLFYILAFRFPITNGV